MRRFYGLLVLLFFSLPFSVAVVGCHHSLAPTYCPGFSDSGPVAGQIAKITFSGNFTTTGESLNFGQIGSALSVTATDCFGDNVSASSPIYGTSNMAIADINPSTGQVCAGTWNRNTGGGVPDYSVCTAPASQPSNLTNAAAYVTATSGGATSNPIAIYVHPSVTSVSIGSPTPTSSCSAALQSPTTSDPSSNCCPANSTLLTNVPVYDQQSCISQNQSAQLVARAYYGGLTDPAHNITCQVGHINFGAQSSSSVVTIDANGIATAAQPGSTTILANASNSGSGSTAGFFSTCPPRSITLSIPGAANSTTPFSVALNNAQALTTTVVDTKGNTITGLPLTFVNTSPQTLSAGSNTATPSFPGTAAVTAVCQPGACNVSPFSQIGYLGNGKPITSNSVTITTAGTSSNQVIVASTNSQFFYSVDFTTSTTGALFKLPYTPNSMVITQDGSTLYFGSTNVLMSASTASGGASAIGAIPGVVLAVSPDGATLVIADPARGTTSLYSSSGGLETVINGVGTRAQWTPDSATVYIAAGNLMLVHSNFSGWTSTPVSTNYQDVAITVPAYGAYFAAGTDTEGRSYCATSVIGTSSTPPPPVTNTFFPLADTQATALSQRVAATTDGAHILGSGVNGTAASLYDVALTPANSPTDPRLVCTTYPAPPVTFTSSTSVKALPVAATSITGVVPASTSNLAFITYTTASTAAGGALPFYIPSTGAVGSIPLSGTATAPITGAFSSDNKTFYTSTSGDNALHIVTVNGATATDTTTLPLNLPAITGTGTAVPNLIAQRVKKATS